MRKTIHLIMIAVILGSTILPYSTAIAALLSDWIDDGYVKIEDNILPPAETQVGSAGAGIYFHNVDSYKYSIKASELNMPAGSEVKELVLLKNNREYKKLTYNPATASYEATIEKDGTHLFEADGTQQTLLYQWWRASGDKTKWAFDLDGVRHWRKSTTIQDSPPANATYFNEPTATNAFGQGTYRVNGSESIPGIFSQTWPYANNALRYNVFWDEIPGNGNVGWSYTTIPIEFDKLGNQSLNYQIDIQKIKHLVKMNYVYSKPKNMAGAIEEWDVSSITNEFSEEKAIAQGYMNVWYRINFTDYSYMVYLPGTNGERRIFYYGGWQMKYKAVVPWYQPLTLVAKYDKGTGLTDLTGGDFCLPDGSMQMSVKLYVPGVMNEDVTTKSYIKWTSSDESIATVSKGLVTAKKAGIVEITAIYSEGKSDESKISKTIEITDCKDVELTLNADIGSCPVVGDVIQINATIQKKDGFVWDFLTTEPHAKLKYKSSKTSVATVSNTGLITLKGKGDVTITATYTEGDGSDPITQEIKIKVNLDEEACDDQLIMTFTADVGKCPVAAATIPSTVKITKEDGTVVTIASGAITYNSSKPSVASVSSAGVITLNASGSATIKATFKEGDKTLTKQITITVNLNDPSCTTPDPDPDPEIPASGCSYIIVPGGTGSTMNGSLLSISPTGKIESQSGEFDVTQGIPSSEYLRTEATTPEYMYDQSYEQQTGKIVYTITATKEFTLTWEEEQEAPPAAEGEEPSPPPPPIPMSETVTNSVTVQVERPYTYWNVGKFDIWTANRALITNYALPNGQSLMPYGTPVTANATQDKTVTNHVFPSECPMITLPPQTIDGGSSKPSVPNFEPEAKSEAESQTKSPSVKNDKAVLKGQTLMSDALTTGGNGPTPSNVPYPSNIVLQNNNLLIDPLKTNYWQSPSTGLMTYTGVFGLSGMPAQRDIPFSVNVVTVHTPVVIYAKASDDKEHDQRINPPIRSTPANPDTDRHAFILDRPFTVTLPTIGQHRNIPGYGYRDYSKYIKKKQIKFPFDVYTETKAAFYPANTWIEVPVNMENVTFFMPVWVTEGSYTVDFRAFALNALDTGDFGGNEREANITIPNPAWNVAPAGTQSAAHTAVDTIEVDVVGRLYDFQVTDIEDFNWKDVFRKADGITPSGNSYFVGLKDIDGNPRGNAQPYVLPVSHASHPNGIKNLAVKKGYTFKFNMKTKGNMESINDAIRITPKFYFVKRDGSNRQEVDLYYHTNDTKFIKIGSAADKMYRQVSLNEPSRNVDMNEITNNAIHYYDFADRFQLDDAKLEHTKTSFARDYAKFRSREAIQTGPYGWQILSWKLRTYMGPLATAVPANTMIPKEETVTKEQTWYGEYSIPSATYVVPKDSKINELGRVQGLPENHPIFLKDGYIIVNFDIETIDEGDIANPRLSYYNAYYMSQWTDMEGFQSTFTDGYGNVFNNQEGDVMYYYGDQSSLDDFDSSVTH